LQILSAAPTLREDAKRGKLHSFEGVFWERLREIALYRSSFTSQAFEDFKRLPKNVRNSLKREFTQKIHIHPIDCSEALSGPLEAFRSFHYRNYRVVYQVLEDLKIVALVGVGKNDLHHHGEIYKRLADLASRGKLAAAVLNTYRSISGADEPNDE
jgi:mRNA-degrading endonuclease RelE of RelBE toxin-antitoxin system